MTPHPATRRPAAAPAAAAARTSVVQLQIKEKGALYAAYISVFANGGIFVPSDKEHRLGDPMYVLISLPGEVQRYPIAGKVAWITPAHSSISRTQGVGIAFPKDERSEQLKAKIEEILGTHLASTRPTQTI